MPTPALKSLAEKHGKSVKTAERYWDEAKNSASNSGHADDYAYIMGIVKRRLEAKVMDIEGAVLARLAVVAGYIGDYISTEEAAAAKPAAGRTVEGVKTAKQRGAEKKIAKPPKLAFKIFSTDNPFGVDGMKYAEFQGKGIEHAAYDPKTASLWISFNGQSLYRWYWYKDVPPATWDQFRRLRMNAIVYFNKEIRPIHDYALIEKAE